MAVVAHAQLEGAQPHLPALGPGQQPAQQHLGTSQHLRGGVGARLQFQRAVEGWGQLQRQARVGAAAVQAVQLLQQRCTEAPGQPAARQCHQVGQALHAHALQGVQVRHGAGQQFHRRGSQ